VDNWHLAGVLPEQYGFRVLYDAQSRLRLNSLLSLSNRCSRYAKSDAFVEIQSRLLEIKIGVCDKPIWSASRKGFYVSYDTWDALRISKTMVDCGSLSGSPYVIPKHAFVLWLAMRDRLLTSDRLSK
jgi:hypothetical protein